MPVVREIFRLAAVIPSARFQENVSPGPNFMPLTVSVELTRILGSALPLVPVGIGELNG
jgi:hypothetical protein